MKCLRKKTGDGVRSYHQILQTMLAVLGRQPVIPLGPEFICNPNLGGDAQDNELKAVHVICMNEWMNEENVRELFRRRRHAGRSRMRGSTH